MLTSNAEHCQDVIASPFPYRIGRLGVCCFGRTAVVRKPLLPENTNSKTFIELVLISARKIGLQIRVS